ncbi:unnamed protein product [Chrysodeixis includens]|uniref:Protein amnionless n=1 Tax=Chrysodeixis includens TaxID=689277 RepID=A0A9P0C0V7_CHRIL|nr:unnamed protein product [Chrysodeixis includens]
MSPILVLHCVAIFGTTLISAAVVKWSPTSSFKLPSKFNDERPCSELVIVFPENVPGSTRIASAIEVGEIVLPENGELILDDTITITFDSHHADTNCTTTNGTYSYYPSWTQFSWKTADVWSSPKFNDATPDSDRIPCYDDIVEFPTEAGYSVELPTAPQYVRAIRLGKQSYTSEEFQQRVIDQSDEEQQFILNKFMETGIRVNQHMPCSQFACACQVIPLEIDCTAKVCPKSSCVSPVKPLGFCCEICGGYVVFNPDRGFDMKAFNELVSNTVKSYDKNSVEYYIGFTPEIPSKRIQLVIVDKGVYQGSSAEIINSISYAIHAHWVKGQKVAEISGSPLDKSGLGGEIFVSMFFAVVLSLGALYVYYYKVPIPDLRFPIFSQSGMSNILSRYQRRSDSIVSLTRRDSVISGTSRGSTAFRNPLYSSKRGRVEVVESVVED